MNRVYDVIIAGGGTAGCVLASRLTEDASLQVLLIEAGKDQSQHPVIPIPSTGGMLWADPEVNWNYSTVPQVCPTTPSLLPKAG